MKTMNLLYFSPSGTTKTVIHTLYNKLGSTEKIEYDLLNQPISETVVIASDTPAIFAMPVFSGRIPAVCADMLKKVKGDNTPAVAIAVYGNREYDDALLELTNILKENGFMVVAAAAFVAEHSIFPQAAAGRPDQQDKEIIAMFGEKCNEALAHFSGKTELFVKGNSPYCEPGEIPLKPLGDSMCNECGICVKVCPTKAIAANAPRETDTSRCISCTACIAACPQKARAFPEPHYSTAQAGFVQRNSERKEPEIFI